MKVAVVGCGYWGPNHLRVLSQRPCFHEHPNGARPSDLFGEPLTPVNLTAVDRDPKQLDRIARHFPHVRRERDLEAVLDDPQIDAVVVATPTSTHRAIVSAALRSGKHVLCEKPLCTDVDEARELVDLSEHVERVLMTGHIFLFHPALQVLKGLIDSDELGDVRYAASIRTNLGPIRSDVNVVYDLVCHDVAIFNWLFDSLPDCVTAMGQGWVQKGIEDVAFVQLRYPHGRIASVHASWLSPQKVRDLTVVGSRRMATWDDLDATNPLVIYDRSARAADDGASNGHPVSVITCDGPSRVVPVPAIEPLRAQDESFLRAVRRGRAEQSSAGFAADVVLVLSAISESLRQGGASVPVTIRGRRELRCHLQSPRAPEPLRTEQTERA